jgi:hypothetical protein
MDISYILQNLYDADFMSAVEAVVVGYRVEHSFQIADPPAAKPIVIKASKSFCAYGMAFGAILTKILGKRSRRSVCSHSIMNLSDY